MNEIAPDNPVYVSGSASVAPAETDVKLVVLVDELSRVVGVAVSVIEGVHADVERIVSLSIIGFVRRTNTAPCTHTTAALPEVCLAAVVGGVAVGMCSIEASGSPTPADYVY